jgi:hypothetical protein
MSSHLEPHQLSPAVAQNQKRKQAIKGQRGNHAQITGTGGLMLLIIQLKFFGCNIP